jgi:hypothetical protein
MDKVMHVTKRRCLSVFLGVIVTFFASVAVLGEEEYLKWFQFSERDALHEWKIKNLKGTVHYRIRYSIGHNGYVHALSLSSAAGLYYQIRFSPEQLPMIGWKWRVIQFPQKESVAQDDYAARIYVIFSSWKLKNSRCLEYVWDEYIPPETVLDSPLTPAIKLIVVRSGYLRKGGWASERRNIFKDYIKAFGKGPTLKVTAIAVMTNSDKSGTRAEACFDDIKIGFKE